VPNFEEAWAAVAGPHNREPLSQELRPLLQDVYEQGLSQHLNVTRFKRSLEALLEFLNDKGRTNANCWAVDSFFCVGQGWERDWADRIFPEDLQGILARIGEALHDTVQFPKIAENFGCLPEQLLESLRKIPDGSSYQLLPGSPGAKLFVGPKHLMRHQDMSGQAS